MEKQDFLDFCEKYFLEHGFKKKSKSLYYKKTKEVLCYMYPEKIAKNKYSVCYCFFIGDYSRTRAYPDFYDADTINKFLVSGLDLSDTEHYFTDVIDCVKYSTDVLIVDFDYNYRRYVLPPIEEGKMAILRNLEHYIYYLNSGYNLAKLMDKLETQLY